MKRNLKLLMIMFFLSSFFNIKAQTFTDVQKKWADEDNFNLGTAVAFDGNIAVVASETYNSNQGIVKVYKYISGTANQGKWEYLADLTASDGAADDYFGGSVDVSGDVIVVGAHKHENSHGNANGGTAYVFVKPSGGWTNMTETAQLEPTNFVNGWFANSVAIDGDIIAVGFENYEYSGISSGSVHIFEKPSGGWTNMSETAILTSSDGADNDYLGYDIDIEGDVVIAGAPYKGQGYVYIFKKSGTNWTNMTETAKLSASDGQSYDYFAWSVALSGNNIAVGAPFVDVSGVTDGGKVYVFEKTVSDWADATETATYSASDPEQYDNFAKNVDINEKYLIVGADRKSVSPYAYVGSLLVFEKGPPWQGWASGTEDYIVNPPDAGAYDVYSSGICLYNDMIITGSKGEDCNGYTDNGAFYSFVARPQRQDANLTVQNIDYTTVDFNITAPGSGFWHTVFVKENTTSVSVIPVDGTSYTADSQFGQGSELNGWYCVYNGELTSSPISISGLNSNTDYRVMVCTYNGSVGNEMYHTGDVYGNVRNFTTKLDLSNVDYNVMNGQLLNTTSEMQYFISGSGWNDCTEGTTSGITFVPGNVIVRESADWSNSRTLANLVRPSAPEISIDYINEQSVENIGTDIEYNFDNDFNSVNNDGNSSVLSLVPGTDVFLRFKATAQDLSSEIQTLIVPDRPAAPNFTIDYVNETTNETVTNTIEYAESSDFTTNHQTGNGTVANITPGIDLWFRTAASNTNENFYGESFNLTISGRPTAPNFTIDYVNETTNETVANTIEYAENSDYTINHQTGDGNITSLNPGTDLWFRTAASNINQNFYGESFNLMVPNRPDNPTNPTVNDDENTFDWTNNSYYTAINDYEFSTNAGSNWDVCSEKPINIGNVDLSIGYVQIRIAASNNIGEKRFKSNNLLSDEEFTFVSLVYHNPVSNIRVYPNPVSSILIIKTNNKINKITITDLLGKVYFERNENSSEVLLNVENLKKGVYFVNIQEDNRSNIKKFIKK